MTFEEAIKTALEFEIRVWKAYQEAEGRATDAVGKRVFGVLASEEKDHVDYLRNRLEEWKANGKVSPGELISAVPTREAIEESLRKLEAPLSGAGKGVEIEPLRKALKTETEASSFYRRMVEGFGEEGRRLFARFLEIEEGHLSLVQAELDYAGRTGVWFDFMEFQL